MRARADIVVEARRGESITGIAREAAGVKPGTVRVRYLDDSVERSLIVKNPCKCLCVYHCARRTYYLVIVAVSRIRSSIRRVNIRADGRAETPISNPACRCRRVVVTQWAIYSHGKKRR